MFSRCRLDIISYSVASIHSNTLSTYCISNLPRRGGVLIVACMQCSFLIRSRRAPIPWSGEEKFSCGVIHENCMYSFHTHPRRIVMSQKNYISTRCTKFNIILGDIYSIRRIILAKKSLTKIVAYHARVHHHYRTFFSISMRYSQYYSNAPPQSRNIYHQIYHEPSNCMSHLHTMPATAVAVVACYYYYSYCSTL